MAAGGMEFTLEGGETKVGDEIAIGYNFPARN